MISKSDITIRHDCGRPTLNVKVQRFGPHTEVIAKRFNCSQEIAQRALNWAWDAAQTAFWQQAESTCRQVFGTHASTSADGRSGGWLTVYGIGIPDEWNAVMLAKWRRFAKLIDADIHDQCDNDNIMDNIAANRWAEPNAEQFNFVDHPDGSMQCLADVPRCAHCR